MIVQQPYINNLGHLLIDQLQNSKFKSFNFIVAYAKSSGVNRLLPYMQLFIKNGGKINGIIGIDQCNTSYEALKSLMNVCNKLHIFHSENFSQTFHPKIYSFENISNFWFAIGSNNLTAGGLFNNYETCFVSDGKVQDENYVAIRQMFESYSNKNSTCYHEVNNDFLELLLSNKYIKKEYDFKSELIQRNKSNSHSIKNILFGNESFKTPFFNAPSPNMDTITTVSQNNYIPNDNNYLIRFIPKAGNRSKQVHFNLDILHNYFNLKPGDGLQLQELSNIYTPHIIENRTIVFSQRNENVKIEINGAHILDTNYPTNTNIRPILIMKKFNSSFFVYMILFNGQSGYNELHTYLSSLPPKRTLAYKILSSNELFNIWPQCPL